MSESMDQDGLAVVLYRCERIDTVSELRDCKLRYVDDDRDGHVLCRYVRRDKCDI